MNFDPLKLQQMLAYMQATQNQIRFDVKYVNYAHNIDINGINEDELIQKAITIFRTEKPNYRVENMNTTLLTKRVLSELIPQLNKSEIILTNGCCNQESCPTTKFLECVLKGIKELK